MHSAGDVRLTEPIVFLDFDGPMIPTRAMLLPENRSGGYQRCPRFDPCGAHLVNILLARTKANLVISSTWRIRSRPVIEAILAHNNIDPNLLHTDWDTPRLFQRSRLQEIMAWITVHSEVTHWVALDDDDSIRNHPNGVHMGMDDGFLMAHYFKATALLGFPEKIVL